MDLEEYCSKRLTDMDTIPSRYVYKLEVKFADGTKEIYRGTSLIAKRVHKRVHKMECSSRYDIVSYRMLIDVDLLLEDSNELFEKIRNIILDIK